MSSFNDYICNKPVCAVVSGIDNPNYFNKVNASRSVQPLKRLTTFATGFGAPDLGFGLGLRSNLTLNNRFQQYQSAFRNPAQVLTNNVSVSQGSNVLGYGYVSANPMGSGPVIAV